MACPTCIVLQCDNPSDVEQYNIQSGLIFTNPTLGFVENCPTGYVCADGYYPIVITIPIGTIKLPVPPTTFPTLQEIVLLLNCCESTVSRTVPVGSTQAQLQAIALALINECAAQQARCDAITNPPAPGVPPPMPVNPPDNPSTSNIRVDVRSTAQTATKVCGAGMTGSISFTVPAGTFGAVLWNPTAALIALTQANVDALALLQAQAQVTVITPPSITDSSPLPSGNAGLAYSEQLDGTGGSGPYTFALASGGLPAGLTLSSSGLISGTPVADGTSTFVISITDFNGRSCSKEFELVIGSVCPVFREDLTNAGMTEPIAAIPAESVSKILVSSLATGKLAIIESVGGVDTVIATNTFPAASNPYGVWVPTVGKFFVFEGSNSADTSLLQINPTTGATEGSAAIDGSVPLTYNPTLDRINLMWDNGGGWGVYAINPATLAVNLEHLATNVNAGDVFYCATGNRLFVNNEPSTAAVGVLNASTYTLVDSYDLFVEAGSSLTVLPFPSTGVECNGLFFVGCEFKNTSFPFARVAVKLAVINPATLTFVGFIDLTAETLNSIVWLQADETLKIVIVKAGTDLITVDADTFDIVCSSTTTDVCIQFAVQPANGRLFVPNHGADTVSVYGH